MNITIKEPIPVDALDHLSPSSLRAFLDCPQMWYAKYIDGVKEGANEFSTFGKVGHKAMEIFFNEKSGHRIEDDDFRLGVLDSCLTQAVNEILTSTSDGWEPFKEMRKILRSWDARQKYDEYDMVATEYEHRLPITSPSGIEVEFLMYIDRVDRGEHERDAGKIRVIDYKFGWMVPSPAELADDVQAQTYALALSKMYPGQDGYVFRIESMRNNSTIGVKFSQAQLDEWEYVLGLRVDDIFNTTEFKATLGNGCRFCPVKSKCEAAKVSIENGGIEALEPEDLINTHIALKAKMAQTKTLLEATTAAMPPVLDRAPGKTITTDHGKVSAVYRRNTVVPREMISKYVPKDELLALGLEKFTTGAWKEKIDAEEDEKRKADMQNAMEDRPTSTFTTKVETAEQRERAANERAEKAAARRAAKK